MRHAASAITAPDADHLSAYWLFHEAVTRAQLAAWLPPGRRLLVDVSGPRASAAELAAQAGHTVLRIIDGGPAGAERGGAGPADTAPEPGAQPARTDGGAGRAGPDSGRNRDGRGGSSGWSPTPRRCRSWPTAARTASSPTTGPCPRIWPPRP